MKLENLKTHQKATIRTLSSFDHFQCHPLGEPFHGFPSRISLLIAEPRSGPTTAVLHPSAMVEQTSASATMINRCEWVGSLATLSQLTAHSHAPQPMVLTVRSGAFVASAALFLNFQNFYPFTQLNLSFYSTKTFLEKSLFGTIPGFRRDLWHGKNLSPNDEVTQCVQNTDCRGDMRDDGEVSS